MLQDETQTNCHRRAKFSWKIWKDANLKTQYKYQHLPKILDTSTIISKHFMAFKPES